jgi:hypothetical protein
LTIPAKIHVLEPRSPETPGNPPADPPPTRADLWRRRMFLVIEVLFFVEVGMVLLVLPWTRIWTDNPILNTSFHVRQIAESGFVRGVLSGLGLVNLYIAISDAVTYRE